jgi:hypothetical protein
MTTGQKPQFAAPKKKPKNCSSPTSISCGLTCLPAKTKAGKDTVCKKPLSPNQKAQKKSIVESAKKTKRSEKVPEKPKETVAIVSKDALKLAQETLDEINVSPISPHYATTETVNTLSNSMRSFATIRGSTAIRAEATLADVSLDINQGIALSRLPRGTVDEQVAKIRAIAATLPNGAGVVLPEGKKSAAVAEKLGLKARVAIDRRTSKEIDTYSGVIGGGKIQQRPDGDDIQLIRLKRAALIRGVTELADEAEILRSAGNLAATIGIKAPTKDEIRQTEQTEDTEHATLDALENKVLNRTPTGSHGDYGYYEKKSAAWAKEKFGDFAAGANGYTLAQTKAHDIAHPVTHDLIGLNSDTIHKKLGALKDDQGNDALYGEEAIVNVIEQLSRGSSVEASILNGVRLARVMTRRDGSKEARAFVRSPEFVGKLSELAHQAYRHNDFAPLIAHVRKSNRLSGTVTAAGDNFNSTASGG